MLAHWRVGTDERRTADEWAVLLRGLLGADLVGFGFRHAMPSGLLGLSYYRLGKSDEALSDFNKAIELEPNEPDGYYRRSDIYREMNKDAEAKAQAKDAYDLYVDTRLYAKKHVYEDILANGINLFGSVETVSAKLRELQEESGGFGCANSPPARSTVTSAS